MFLGAVTQRTALQYSPWYQLLYLPIHNMIYPLLTGCKHFLLNWTIFPEISPTRISLSGWISDISPTAWKIFPFPLGNKKCRSNKTKHSYCHYNFLLPFYFTKPFRLVREIWIYCHHMTKLNCLRGLEVAQSCARKESLDTRKYGIQINKRGWRFRIFLSNWPCRNHIDRMVTWDSESLKTM